MLPHFLCRIKMNNSVAEGGNPGNPLADPQIVTLITVSFALNFILSFPANAYVAWLILTGAGGTMASDFFSLNLAVCDILFCLCSTWQFLHLHGKCAFCFKASMFSLGLFYTARPLFGCLMCVEPYIGVVHPVAFLRYKPLRYRVACCCVAWVIVLLSCIYSLLTYNNHLYLYVFFIQNWLLLFVMLFCCLSVLRDLKLPGPGQGETERKSSNKVKKQAFKIISIVMISMFSQLSLYLAVIPLQCCLDICKFTITMTILMNLALMTGFVQPLLYLRRTGKLCFRHAQ